MVRWSHPHTHKIQTYCELLPFDILPISTVHHLNWNMPLMVSTELSTRCCCEGPCNQASRRSHARYCFHTTDVQYYSSIDINVNISYIMFVHLYVYICILHIYTVLHIFVEILYILLLLSKILATSSAPSREFDDRSSKSQS